MFHRHKHTRSKTDHVEPDLPITPMLDMSFQLMAFFLITFRPMPTEGQMALALPMKDGGAQTVKMDTPLDEKPEDITVTIDATPEGRIASILWVDSVGTQNLGAELKKYQQTVKDKVDATTKANKKLGKLKLEIDKSLVHEYVVGLIDISVRAGYTDITPEPRREGGAAK